VLISNPFNFEFMENASTVALPAYLPVDSGDVHAALTAIDRQLHAEHPNRLGNRALMGYSMGAIESLFIAATGPTNHYTVVKPGNVFHFREGKQGVQTVSFAAVTNTVPLIRFDRFVAINSPVRMAQGILKLDEFYDAPLGWPETNRIDNIENTFLKVAALSQTTLTPQTTLPFSAIESKFLIGLAFRLTLRDIIFISQQRDNMGVLQHPISNWRRDPVYQEILQYSYQDYFDKFAIPYYRSRGLVEPVAETMEKNGDLRTYETGLRANPNVRIIDNQNDFLLTDADLAWLHATFGTNQLTIFPTGGHLGNLGNPAVQKSILAALTPMRPPNPAPEAPLQKSTP